MPVIKATFGGVTVLGAEDCVLFEGMVIVIYLIAACALLAGARGQFDA
jgi:hypothetical protein